MTESPIVMPKLGLTMSEGLLAEWSVKPGDEVQAGQVLFVVETDKISNEIEAPAAGRITRVLVGEGETVDVGTPVALWTGPGQAAAPRNGESAPASPPPAPSPASARDDRATSERVRSTPMARRLARQAGIAIEACVGTGPRGRIQARDVQEKLASAATRPAAKGRDLRAIIAARVARSQAEVPHFYLTADAAVDSLMALRRELNGDPLSPRKISVTAFLATAVARALRLAPEANVLWRDGRTVACADVGIGVAVDTAAGVMAPVIRVEAGEGLYAIAARLEGAIERARAGRLSAADAGEAAIGLSNVGMFRVRALAPIIDPDQTFMLGVGAPMPAFRPAPDGSPVAVQLLTLTLACDHRAIDGAAAARFLAAIVELIEQPARLTIST